MNALAPDSVPGRTPRGAVGAAAGRARPQGPVVVDHERRRRRIVAGQAVALVEVIDAVGGHHVDAVAGADPQPAIAVLTEEVRHAAGQSVGGPVVLEPRDLA